MKYTLWNDNGANDSTMTECDTLANTLQVLIARANVGRITLTNKHGDTALVTFDKWDSEGGLKGVRDTWGVGDEESASMGCKGQALADVLNVLNLRYVEQDKQESEQGNAYAAQALAALDALLEHEHKHGKIGVGELGAEQGKLEEIAVSLYAQAWDNEQANGMGLSEADKLQDMCTLYGGGCSWTMDSDKRAKELQGIRDSLLMWRDY